jgi:hypothetical protein
MALRKPVVVVNGQLQQLQAGDTLDAPQSGGDQIILTNDEASPVVIGAPVYMDAVSGFKKAQANAAGTKNVIGLVAKSPSITNATDGAGADERRSHSDHAAVGRGHEPTPAGSRSTASTTSTRRLRAS